MSAVYTQYAIIQTDKKSPAAISTAGRGRKEAGGLFMKKDFLSFTMKCLNWLLFCAALWALREIYPDCPFLIISSVLVYFSVLILMIFYMVEFLKTIKDIREE